MLMEYSLKVCFYHHLRALLGDGWFVRHRLRMYPEYRVEGGAKVDLAIVRISRAAERATVHLRDAVEEHVAFIEFKYKGGYSRAPFYQDIDKLRAYSKSYPDCMLYAGFVHEKYYGDGATWVADDGAAAWAEDRLTELVGYWDESTDLFATSIRRF